MKMRHLVLSIAAVWALSRGAEAQTYTYDAAGRLTGAVFPSGRAFSYSYNAADNLLSAASSSAPLPPVSVQAVRISSTQVRVDWQPSAASPSGFVIFRRPAQGGAWVEIASVGGAVRQFIDTTADSSTDYVYRVAARTNGVTSAYSSDALVSSPSAIALSIDAGGARNLVTQNSSGATRTGYASVEVDTGSDPYGTAVFRFRQGGVIVSEAAVPASPPTRATRVFIEYRSAVSSTSGQYQGTIDVNTGIAAVNTNAQAASLTFTLRNPAGQIIAYGEGTLAAGAHFARFISELSTIAAGFNLPLDFPTSTAFGSLDVVSSQPLSMMALRLTNNQRGEALITSTPVSDLSIEPQGANVQFPQFVDGGGYSTTLILLNTSNSLQSGKLELRNNSGGLLNAKPIGGSSGSSFDMIIPARGLAVFETDGSPVNTNAGWARWIPGANQTSPVGSGVFRLALGGIVVTESGVASANPTKHARIYVDKTAGRDTGIAVANPGTSAATITVKAYQLDGTTEVGVSTNLSLVANGHDAKLSGELVSGLPAGFTGVFDLSSDTAFSALTLRILSNSRNEVLFTTFPVADQTRRAPSPIIFPQIADGGGYETDLILLGPVTASSVVVRFFDDQGLPLAVGSLPQ